MEWIQDPGSCCLLPRGPTPASAAGLTLCLQVSGADRGEGPRASSLQAGTAEQTDRPHLLPVHPPLVPPLFILLTKGTHHHGRAGGHEIILEAMGRHFGNKGPPSTR